MGTKYGCNDSFMGTKFGCNLRHKENQICLQSLLSQGLNMLAIMITKGPKYVCNLDQRGADMLAIPIIKGTKYTNNLFQ